MFQCIRNDIYCSQANKALCEVGYKNNRNDDITPSSHRKHTVVKDKDAGPFTAWLAE